MRTASSAISLALLLSLLAVASSAMDNLVPGEDFIPGQMTVMFAPGSCRDGAVVEAVLRDAAPGAVLSVEWFFKDPARMDAVAREHGLDRIWLVEVDKAADHVRLRETLSHLPGVESVDLNWIMKLQWTPNDPFFSEQWGLQQDSDIDVDAPEAWDIERGDSAVVIGIIDSGIDYTHADLGNKIWSNDDEIVDGVDNDGNGYVDDIRGWDFVSASSPSCVDPDCSDEDNDPMDGYGHGTWVSGVAGAETDNESGIAAVCPGCVLMPCRACWGDYSGGACDMYAIAYGVFYATENGAKVVNISLAWNPMQDHCYTYGMFDAVLDYAYAHGVTVVAAAGSSNSSWFTYPACYPTVIGVASHSPNGARSIFSDYGDWVDVAAPGLDIKTTDLGGYITISGTSFSSAYVAALAGLLLSVRRDLTPDQIRQIIMDSSEDKEYWQSVPIAAGRINAYNALLTAGVDEVEAASLASVFLGNYPNPFNPATTIRYTLPQAASVTLAVYGISGRLVRVLEKPSPRAAGEHVVTWDGCDNSGARAASGAYFYRLEVDGDAVARKMILVE